MILCPCHYLTLSGITNLQLYYSLNSKFIEIVRFNSTRRNYNNPNLYFSRKYTFCAMRISSISDSDSMGSVAVLKISLTDCSRSEEHTSELQSRPHLVCRLLL